ncbi:tetratricopeptide repeat protein [Nocardiopsis dassonvillei]|uniref:tetratricopeptide repeat protein n=1 Tax=Nocardiopsis dassonvillei TaxID=2014 RepID=UPI003641E22D
MADNRASDVQGTLIQAHVIHGPITVYSPPTTPVPAWVDTALPIREYAAGELGIHHSVPDVDGSELPPYVVRDVDSELDQRLAAVAVSPRGGLVLVTGASTAGKTRALVAALSRTLPDRMLVAPPEDADLRSLPTWLKARTACAPQGWTVWLDDLDRHLGASGLTPALVAELGQVGALVTATIRRNQLDALRPRATDHPSASERMGYAVLKTSPVVVERQWSSQERERARSSGDVRLIKAASDERFGVAEQLAAGPVLGPFWRSGPETGNPRGYALVAAAVGLAQAGVASPLTREQIEAVHGVYLPDPPPLAEEADQAWAWATRPRSGLTGLLVPADHDGRWRAFDYLTLQDPLPETVWRAALDTATEQERFAVGLRASRCDRADVAEAAWRPLAEQGDADAMTGLGLVLEDTAAEGEAAVWFQRAAGRGHTIAMVAFGHVLEAMGRLEEAEFWYRQAAAKGNPNAMTGLGLLLSGTERLTEAESWYRQASDRGHAVAMVNLGVLLTETGRLGEAESWYRQAAEQGDAEAVCQLGHLLEDSGRVREAESWFREGARRGDPNAMYRLGLLLETSDDAEEAESWYRRAADEGHAVATYFLGHLLKDTRIFGEAESLFRQRAEKGDSNAMTGLGLALRDADKPLEAESWFRRAADEGDVFAMYFLGSLLGGGGEIGGS